MNIILASYGRIFWRWRESDPHQVIVDKARKISLVNPKHYFEPEFRSDRCCWRLGDGSVVLETDHIGLHIESIEDESDPKKVLSEAKKAISESDVVQRLRAASRKTNLPRQYFALTFKNIKLDTPAPINADKSEGAFLAESVLSTTFDLKNFDGCPYFNGSSLPVFDLLLLDAVEAYQSQDYRRAILFAAMAMEVGLREKLDETYEELAKKESTDPKLRFRKIPVGGGGAVYKDSVFERLSRADDARVLLHELPLYLIQKSLMYDHSATFDACLRLINTRNKIAHHGQPSTDEIGKCFPLDQDGAFQSLTASHEALHWIGLEVKRTFSPKYRMINLDTMKPLEM